MRRRELLRGGLALALAPPLTAAAEPRARVVGVKADDRQDGVRRALGLLGASWLERKHVFVKRNFNSADPFPGSTHPDTLAALVGWLGGAGARAVTVADRSGMVGSAPMIVQLAVLPPVLASRS